MASLFQVRLSELRQSFNLNQKEFAKIMGISPSTVAKYETGDREPDYETLIKFADFFGVSTDYLLGRSNNPQMTEIEIAIRGLPLETQKLLLDKNNTLPALDFIAEYIKSGIPLEELRDILKSIANINKRLQEKQD